MKLIALIFLTFRLYPLAVAVLMIAIAYDFACWLMRKADQKEKDEMKIKVKIPKTILPVDSLDNF